MSRPFFASFAYFAVSVVGLLPVALFAQVQTGNVHFTEITQSAGIHFVHNNGAFGSKYLPETLGSGCAFIDYDNDGYPDILLINGEDWPGHHRSASTLKLYHNEHNGTFTDVTVEAGLAISMYGMGVAVGDYDNDAHGWITTATESWIYWSAIMFSGRPKPTFAARWMERTNLTVRRSPIKESRCGCGITLAVAGLKM